MSDALRIIPLGGLGEVGKNMTVYEAAGELLVVDAGLAFPRDEHLGVDLLLPDVSYLEGRRVRAVVLTHGHEDHVGGLPYLLREVEVQTVVATRLTLGLVKSKLDEHGLGQAAELLEAEPGDEPLELGPFRLELIRVAHSIPDSVALVIETGAGRVVHTGDWKLDHTPVDGLRTDVGTLAEVGNRGVDLLLGDSTNAERPGSTGSERLVGRGLPHALPAPHGTHPRRLLRLEHPPHAAGRGRRDRVRPQDHRRRPLDAQEPQHRAEPRLRGHPGGGDPSPRARLRSSRPARCSRSAPAARASRCPRSRASRTATTRRSRSSRATR